MRRLRALAGDRRGNTLAETLCAMVLLVICIELCGAAVSPAGRIMKRLRTLADAQVVLDTVLESVRAEVEDARDYVKRYDNFPDGTGPALEFTAGNGYTLVISSGGTGGGPDGEWRKTRLVTVSSGDTPVIEDCGGAGEPVYRDGVGPGRLLYRYYHAPDPESETAPRFYYYEKSGELIARELTTVFGEEAFLGMYLKLDFEPLDLTRAAVYDEFGGVIGEKTCCKKVHITGTLYGELNGDGTIREESMICSSSLTAGLFHGGENGLELVSGTTAMEYR